MPPPARAARHLRRLLWLLLAGMALAALAGAGVLLGYRHGEVLDHAAQRAEDTARLLEENARGMLRATGFIVTEAARIADGEHARPARSRLISLQTALPEKGALAIVAADGTLEQVAGDVTPPTVNIADRIYFQALREGADTVIGPLGESPLGPTPAFTVGQRITGPRGTFAGAAIAAIEAGSFAQLFEGLDLGPQAIIGLYRTDGTTVLRLPDPERWENTTISDGSLMRTVSQAPQGRVRAASPLDGVERILAYRTLPDLGVLVVCGVAVDDALAPWRHAAAVVALGLGVLAALFGILATFAFRSLEREQTAVQDLENRVRERTEEARRQAEEARRANEGKTRFLAGASHDLRQPLQAAGMFVEVLAGRLAESPHQSLVDKLRQSIDATGTLLSTLLDISTLESGKVKPDLTAFPLMPMLASLADQMEPEAAERGLQLRVAPTSVWVISDRVLLERLLRNLMVNALRYTLSGGMVVGCRRRGDRIAVQVVDSGVGIPEDKLEAIFEDFTRLDSVRGASRRGPGLGLGVVRRTAALLGHRVEVRSTVGRGSAFTVLVHAAAVRRRPLDAPVESEHLAG